MASFYSKGTKADALRRFKSAHTGISRFRHNCLQCQVDAETLWTLTQLIALGTLAKWNDDGKAYGLWEARLKRFLKNLNGPAERLARLYYNAQYAKSDAERLGATEAEIVLAREEGVREGWNQ